MKTFRSATWSVTANLPRAIHDAGWGIFLQWLARYGFLHDIPVIAVATALHQPEMLRLWHHRQEIASAFGRTSVTGCGVVLDRDHNAALNILQKALSPIKTVPRGTREPDGLAPQNASGQWTSTVVPSKGEWQVRLDEGRTPWIYSGECQDDRTLEADIKFAHVVGLRHSDEKAPRIYRRG